MAQTIMESNKSRNILSAIRQCIFDILNPIGNATTNAENNMQVLEYTDEFGIHLTTIALDKSENMGIRQLAAVILNQYIEVHWTALSNKFRDPEVTDTAKSHIKTILPCALNDADSKMRSSVAHAVARIAYWDWPDKWPELFDILSQGLSGDDNSVHGSMKVLLEFTKDVNQEQLPTIAPLILSEVYRIFDADTVYRSKTRAQAVEIFIIFSEYIFLKSAYTKGLCNSIWMPAVPQFIERFAYSLNNESTDCFLKSQIIRAICYLMDLIPRKKIAPHMAQLFPLIWNLFRQVTQDYQKLVVNGSPNSEHIYDLDGDLFSYEKYTILFLDFMTHVIRSRDNQIELIMPNLLTILLILMKITREQKECWTEDPDIFLEEDCMDKPLPITVRHKSLALFVLLCNIYKERSFIVLGPALVQYIQASEYEKSTGDINWWKGHEATMYALGSIKEILHNHCNNRIELNIPELMKNALSHLCHQNMDFLVGRCLWLSGKFADSLPPQVMMQYLQALQENISLHKSTTVRILALKTLMCYCGNLPVENSEVMNLFTSYIPMFYHGLIEVCQNCKSNELGLTLHALTKIVSMDPTYNEIIESKIIPTVIMIFTKFNSDPNILELVQDLLAILSFNMQYQNAVSSAFTPLLVDIFNSDVNADTVDRGLQAVALDMLRSLIMNSKPPLNDLLLRVAFPQAAECILKSDDHATLQSGGECLRAYLTISPEEVCSFRSGAGLGYIVQVVSQLLDPNASEFAATFIGRLVITLITKAGNLLGEHVDIILKSVLSKLQRAETLSVVMSLVIIFAHLFLTQMEAVINFLMTVPGPMGKPALDYVFTEWFNRQHLFYGRYERKVSTLALCKLFEYIISSNDTRLTSVKVKAEPSQGSCGTPSATPANIEVYPEISVTFKIFKLLLLELGNLMREETTNIKSSNSAQNVNNAQTENLEFNDDEPNRRVVLSDDDDDDDEYDSDDEDIYENYAEDYMNEPIFQINMLQHMKDFVTTFANSPSFPPFVAYLDVKEQKTLRELNINFYS